MGGFWLPFGRGLGGSGASLGHSWALLGCFLGVQKPTSSKHWSKMGSKRPSGSILEPFWEGLGRFWGGFGPIFGGILEELGAEHGRALKRQSTEMGRACSFKLFYVRTPALSREAPRSVPMRGGPRPTSVLDDYSPTSLQFSLGRGFAPF